jgi:hypothetical protein
VQVFEKHESSCEETSYNTFPKRGSEKIAHDVKPKSPEKYRLRGPHTCLKNKLRLNAKSILYPSLKKDTILVIDDDS